MGTPDFAVTSLDRLASDEHFEIVAVVSQPDRPAGRKMQLTPSPVKTRALELGLKVFTPETVNTEEFHNQILELKAESAVVVAFGQILGQKFLDLFQKGCVNVHGSILPRWRGAAPIQRALMAGDKESGVALQKIVRKLDAGDVLGIRRVPLGDEMNAVELYDQLRALGADLLVVEYMDYLRGNLAPTPQDESQVTFAAKIDKAEAKIDWAWPAIKIHNLIRGLALGPQPFAVRDDQQTAKSVKLLKTKVVSGKGKPGEIVNVGSESFTVATADGCLEVFEVQPESRARMPSADFIRGYQIKKGEVLL